MTAWTQACDVCQSDALTIAFKKGEYSVAFCAVCGHGCPVPMPGDEQLKAFYSRGHRPSALDGSSYAEERLRVLNRIQALSTARPRTLLDVGCGFGHYLDTARELGFDASGYEIDEGRVSVCASKGYKVWSGETLAAVPVAVKWDVVILNHVIEHLRDPRELLSQIAMRMHDSSLLFVGCPNFRGFRARVEGPHYDHICPPEHIQYFSEQSLQLTLQGAGFRKIAIDHFTNEVLVKKLFAFLLKGKWMRAANGAVPDQIPDDPPKRFVDGNYPTLRRFAYSGLLAVSKAFVPFVNRAGGDHFESYWVLAGR